MRILGAMRIPPGLVSGLAVASAVGAALGAGCAGADPGLRVAEPPHAAAAADVDRADLSFTARDGLTLYAQRWRPRTGEPRAAIVIHHGLADHSDRYAGFAERLVHAGYAVWAFDMRGHGRSAGVRVQIDRVDDLLDDLDAFVALVSGREPGRPIVLYGHSLGGLVTALYAIEHRPEVAGVVLAAPGIAFDAPPIQAGAIRLIAALAPNAPVLDVPHAQFSADRGVVAEMNADPLIAQGSGPARTACTAIAGVARVWAHPERLVAPLLIVHGRADAITAPSGSRDLVARAGAADRTLRLYDGIHHDVLRDPGSDRVAADIVAWIDAHTGGAAAHLDPPAASPLAAGPLAGDRSPQTMAVELDVRGEHDTAATGATAGLRLRLTTGASLGYAGGVDLRAGYLGGGIYEADGHLLGVAARAGAATVSLTAGAGIGGVRGNTATHLPVELALEAPVGPTHLVARAGLGWRLGGERYAGDALGLADEATALVGLRLGRDTGYWSTVRAGAGPFVALGYRNLGGVDVWGITLGAELWSGN